jgi:uncharacterized peroxidase-related enzyme
MFISYNPESEASGELADLYLKEREFWGYLPNYALLFGHRPQVWSAWRHLIGAIREGMDRRRYELATLAAATTLRSSYCSLAHGKALTAFYSPEEVRDLVRDPERLSESDREVMAFAARVAEDASTITEGDVERLRRAGLSDAEIFDVAAAASARAFFAKLLDSLGADPDHQFRRLDPALVEALTVGRPVADPTPG